MALNYFYDGQYRKYIEQFGRIFCNFQYYSGQASDGTPIYKTVPLMWASPSRQAMSVLLNNSENTINSVPMFAYYITDMRPSPERRQNPTFVRQLGVTYQDVDSNGYYNGKIGNQYMVESYMPVPYDATFKLDLWFSNELQRQQIAEQIQMLFNPTIDIQTNRNLLDWSSLTTVTLEDISWNPPMWGTTNTTDSNMLMSWTFSVPIWLNPPSKVKKANFINEIIIDINQVTGDGLSEDGGNILARTVVTPGNFKIDVTRDYSDANHYIASLVIDPGNKTDDNGVAWDWDVLTQKYGKVMEGSSTMLLMTDIVNYDDMLENGQTEAENRIIGGTIEIDEDDPTKLHYIIDPSTLPQSIYQTYSINSYIDPSKEHPLEGRGACKNAGFTYLILNTIPQNSELWGVVYENGSPVPGLTAAIQGDILQFDGTKWIKIFNSLSPAKNIFAKNVCNNDWLTFDNGEWRMTIEGQYNPGYWKLRL